MSERFPEKARFHHDSLIALATMDDNKPCVRTVNSFYEEWGIIMIPISWTLLSMKKRTGDRRFGKC